MQIKISIRYYLILGHSAEVEKPKNQVLLKMQNKGRSTRQVGAGKDTPTCGNPRVLSSRIGQAPSLPSRNPASGTHFRENLANVHLESRERTFIAAALSVMETTHMPINYKIENVIVLRELETCK